MYPLKAKIGDELLELVELLSEWRSGEEIAVKFGISRNAVWKKIQRLKEVGFVIEARKGKGYRIKKAPEFSILSVLRAVKEANAEKVIKRIYYYTETDSTNNRARDLEAGSLVIAERQHSGKGRLGREWFSEKGGLYFSIVLEPKLSIEDVPKVTLTAGVGVAEALSDFKARLKWPNDVLIDGKKVCGILSEIVGEVERPKVIVGIGINVENPVPEGAVSLASLGRASREEILSKVIRSFSLRYNELCEGGWEKIRRRWIELADTIGKQVKVTAAGKTYIGEAVALDVDGGLLLDVNGRIEKVYSGDCFYI